MAKIEKFEDIESWKLARDVVGQIYSMSSIGEFARDYALRDQIRRAGISIMSNIAEGFEREGNKEFVNFLCIAKASCAEARSQLYIALDQNYINEDQFHGAYKKLDETGKIIGGFIRYLSGSEYKGSRYK